MSVRLPSISTIDGAGAGVLAVLTAGAYFAAYAPMNDARASDTEQRATLVQQRETLEERDRQLRDLRVAAADSLARLDAAIPLESPSRLTRRMSAFPELAERCRVELLETLPKAAIPGKQFVRVPLGVNGTGTYTAFTSFVAEITARFPDMEVVSFQITGQPEDPLQPARFSVELMWFTIADGADQAEKPVSKATGPHPVR